MGQLLLVRHGQASWGELDYDVLSPLGWEQARLLGAALGERGLQPDVIVQGEMRRHRETTDAVCKGAGWDKSTVIDDVGWNEFDHISMLAAHPAPDLGEREATRAEFQLWFEAATDRWTSGKHETDYPESFAAFTARVDSALARTAELVGPDGTGIVMTSGGPVSWAAASLLGGVSPIGSAVLWANLNRVVVNSSVTKVVVGGRGATLVTFNEHSHLEGDGLTYR